MGNCRASRLVSGSILEEDDAVSLCNHRKRLLKLALRRRHSLAAAHHRYFLSLRSLAASLNLFIATHSSPLFIALPQTPSSPPPPPPPPLLCPKTQSFSLSASSPSSSSSSPSPSSSSYNYNAAVDEQQQQQMGCGYFFPGLDPLPSSSPVEDFGWDFFNPFQEAEAEAEAEAGMLMCRSCDEDLEVVRQQEGIPELEDDEEEEEEEEKKGDDGEVAAPAPPPEKERELLDALREVEDHFIRAYECGKDVGKMLEITWVDPSSDFDEIKENSSKLIKAITWHRLPSTRSSSSKSYLASSSKDTLSIESKSDLFDDYSGMESGSHSQTLGRLYAWEKKLYEEVKAGDHTRQVYEKKCLHLRNQQDTNGVDSHSVDKIRASVRDSHTSIMVALRSIETISNRIQKVIDEELQLQFIELLKGLMKTWKIMLESHETQKQIMLEVISFSCPTYGKFSTDAQRKVTVRLESELRNWRECFINYISAQRDYVEALDGWLSKFFILDLQQHHYPHCESSVPLLINICHEWLNSTKKLTDKSISLSMKGFIKAIRFLWVKQGEEQQQKKKVDIFIKKLERRILSFQKAENKVLERKLSNINIEPDVTDRVEYLGERKGLLEGFRKKVEMEKAKHQECMKETQQVMLDGFKIQLTDVFESLTEFSKDCLKLYTELLGQNDKGKEAAEIEGKPPCLDSR